MQIYLSFVHSEKTVMVNNSTNINKTNTNLKQLNTNRPQHVAQKSTVVQNIFSSPTECNIKVQIIPMNGHIIKYDRHCILIVLTMTAIVFLLPY